MNRRPNRAVSLDSRALLEGLKQGVSRGSHHRRNRGRAKVSLVKGFADEPTVAADSPSLQGIRVDARRVVVAIPLRSVERIRTQTDRQLLLAGSAARAIPLGAGNWVLGTACNDASVIISRDHGNSTKYAHSGLTSGCKLWGARPSGPVERRAVRAPVGRCELLTSFLIPELLSLPRAGNRPPWHWKVIITLAVNVVLFVEVSFRAVRKRERQRDEYRSKLQLIDQARPHIVLREPTAQYVEPVQIQAVGNVTNVVSFIRVHFVNEPPDCRFPIPSRVMFARKSVFLNLRPRVDCF